MCWPRMIHLLLLIAVLTIGVRTFAQTTEAVLAQLPIAPTAGQLGALSRLSPGLAPKQVQTESQSRRTSRVPPLLTAEQARSREAVRALGEDVHRFVRVELTDGRVQTGVIIALDEGGFQLRGGIVKTQRIEYSRLKEPPRRVPAVGTHIANGLKWGGLIVLAIPVAILLLPLGLTGVLPDC